MCTSLCDQPSNIAFGKLPSFVGHMLICLTMPTIAFVGGCAPTCPNQAPWIHLKDPVKDSSSDSTSNVGWARNGAPGSDI